MGQPSMGVSRARGERTVWIIAYKDSRGNQVRERYLMSNAAVRRRLELDENGIYAEVYSTRQKGVR